MWKVKQGLGKKRHHTSIEKITKYTVTPLIVQMIMVTENENLLLIFFVFQTHVPDSSSDSDECSDITVNTTVHRTRSVENRDVSW